MEDKHKVRIRMYRQGLGDCFLLTFFSGEERKEFHMLIDCGTLGAASGLQMNEVIQHILDTTGKHIHVLVVTHEHQDHVSGFNTRKSDERRMFEDFTIDNVWLAWTEDRKKLASIELKKDHAELKSALKLTVQTLWNNASPNNEEKQALREVASRVRELLNFSVASFLQEDVMGANGGEPGMIGFSESIDEAMDYASRIAKKDPEYFIPGDVIERQEVKGWRFYVLGPPQSKRLINRADDAKDSLYGSENHLAADISANSPFLHSNLPAAEYRASLGPDARAQFDAGLPFDACFRIEEGIDGTGDAYAGLFAGYRLEDWRCIDYDWLASAEDLALQLDNATNNTSLVLAMEHIEDGRVLLFAGDAQLGNWQSWDGSLEDPKLAQFALKEFKTRDGIILKGKNNASVTPADLLNRTVFYKVGHHSSHNATTRKGLSAMASRDLVAMVSLDSKVAANRHPGWNFPNPDLYKALLIATNGRVMRSDMGWPSTDEGTQRGGLWNDTSWKEIKAQMDAEGAIKPVEEQIEPDAVHHKDQTGEGFKYYRNSYTAEGKYRIEEYYYKDAEGTKKFRGDAIYIDYLFY